VLWAKDKSYNVYNPREGFLDWADQIWNGNREWNGHEVDSDGKATGKMKPLIGEPFLPMNGPRGALSLGGFAKGVTEAEIFAINKVFGGITTMNGHPSTALATAANYEGFYRKAAVIIRSIVKTHMFDNGNKRTAHAVYDLSVKRNGITTGASAKIVQKILNQVATGELSSIDDIANALRGF
jgi:death-on-curing family protein